MLPELGALLAVAPLNADTAALQRLAVDEDALHKPSAANRVKTFAFLRRLYGLNIQFPAYREFTRLCHLSAAETCVLAGTLAFAREPVLRACSEMVLAVSVGTPLRREDFEAWVREYAPGRYSQAMNVSFSHNLYAHFSNLVFWAKQLVKPEFASAATFGPPQSPTPHSSIGLRV